MSLHLDEARRRAADLAARHGEPRCHADELHDIADMLQRHGERGCIRDLACDALRDIADQVRAWQASAAPVGHYGALPPDVVILREWAQRRAGR